MKNSELLVSTSKALQLEKHFLFWKQAINITKLPLTESCKVSPSEKNKTRSQLDWSTSRQEKRMNL